MNGPDQQPARGFLPEYIALASRLKTAGAGRHLDDRLQRGKQDLRSARRPSALHFIFEEIDAVATAFIDADNMLTAACLCGATLPSIRLIHFRAQDQTTPAIAQNRPRNHRTAARCLAAAGAAKDGGAFASIPAVPAILHYVRKLQQGHIKI